MTHTIAVYYAARRLVKMLVNRLQQITPIQPIINVELEHCCLSAYLSESHNIMLCSSLKLM